MERFAAWTRTAEPNIHRLMFRRSGRISYAFDLLMLNGRDLRSLALTERKARSRASC